jgi:hypothetical protein
VRCFNFSSPTTVDELEPRESAAPVISLQHTSPEDPIPNGALGEHLNAILLELVRRVVQFSRSD